MLTRIEIDGFKTFSDFGVDFLPFTAIVGMNAAGKSNLFDVLQLLSRLARHGSIAEAFTGLRGKPHECFRKTGTGSALKRIDIAAEFLLDASVQDPYGLKIDLGCTRIRYEVSIEQRKNDVGVERLQLVRERVSPIPKAEDRFWHRNGKDASAFNNAYARHTKKRRPYLDTVESDGVPSFCIYPEGHGGQKRLIPGAGVESSVMASVANGQDTPTLYALKEELKSWRFVQLDPRDLRRSSGMMASDELEPSGANLPTVLARLKAETRTESQPEGALVDIAADLVHVIGEVDGIRVREDKGNQENYVEIAMRDGTTFSSGVTSDGTLRVLALLAILHDPRRIGLIAVEEPEDGVHPGRLVELIKTLRDLVTPLDDESCDPELSLRQLVVSSHSPYMTELLREEGEIVHLVTVTSIDPARHTSERKTFAIDAARTIAMRVVA